MSRFENRFETSTDKERTSSSERFVPYRMLTAEEALKKTFPKFTKAHIDSINRTYATYEFGKFKSGHLGFLPGNKQEKQGDSLFTPDEFQQLMEKHKNKED